MTAPIVIPCVKYFWKQIKMVTIGIAGIDGAGELRTFWSVVFPVVKPGVGALSIFTFINTIKMVTIGIAASAAPAISGPYSMTSADCSRAILTMGRSALNASAR